MKKICISYETGNGRLGGHYTQFAFTGLPGVEIAALADSNPESEKNFRLTGAEKRYTDTMSMLETERPDIVVLCSRLPEDHYEQIKYAISLGIHVLVEKPLADDLIKADELVAKAKSANVFVQIAHLARFAPTFREMKKRIEEGVIGRPLNCYMRGKEDPRGGGEDMLVLGTHLLDASAFLFGCPESVLADVRQNGTPICPSDLLKTNEPIGPCAGDEVFSSFRYANGVRGIFESRRAIIPTGGCPRMGIVVAGTKGVFRVSYDGDRELQYSTDFPLPYEAGPKYEKVVFNSAPEIPGAVPFDYDYYGLDSKLAWQRYFGDNNRRAAWNLLQAVEGKEELTASAESALASLEMIVGTYRSSIEGRRLSLPLENRKHPLHK